MLRYLLCLETVRPDAVISIWERDAHHQISRFCQQIKLWAVIWRKLSTSEKTYFDFWWRVRQKPTVNFNMQNLWVKISSKKSDGSTNISDIPAEFSHSATEFLKPKANNFYFQFRPDSWYLFMSVRGTNAHCFWLKWWRSHEYRLITEAKTTRKTGLSQKWNLSKQTDWLSNFRVPHWVTCGQNNKKKNCSKKYK